MKLFYTPNPEILSLDETNHAKNVLRLSKNACIDTMDGKLYRSLYSISHFTSCY